MHIGAIALIFIALFVAWVLLVALGRIGFYGIKLLVKFLIRNERGMLL